MYLIRGEDSYLINQELQKIIDLKFENQDDYSIITYNESIDLEQLSDDIFNQSLFSFKKQVIVLKNIDFFNSKKKNDNKKMNDFLQLLEKGQDNNLIFILQDIKKNDISFNPSLAYKKIEYISKIIEIKKPSDKDVYNYIKEYILKNGGNISPTTLLDFLSMFPNDLQQIINEVDKLLLQNKNIDMLLINNSNIISSDNIEFNLSNCILKQKSIDIIEAIDEQKKYGNGASEILSQISYLFYQIYCTYLLMQNTSDNEYISKTLSIHSYRIKLFMSYIKRTNKHKLKELIMLLADMDIAIKSGLLDEENALNKFILFYIEI